MEADAESTIAELQNQASSIATETWSSPRRTTPRTLFHYTGSSALQSILEKGRLWATHVGYLNDTSELSYGIGILHEELRSRECNSHSATEKLLWSRLGNELDQNALSDSEFYITCFCTEENLLSQWRGYGSSSGYAIGFRTFTLMQSTEALAYGAVKEVVPASQQVKGERPIALSPQPAIRTVEHVLNPVLVPVCYDTNEQRQLFGRILDCAHSPTARALHLEEPGMVAKLLAGALRKALSAALISMKHRSFESEAEWRLVYWDRDKPGFFRANRILNFRTNTKHFVPYLDVCLRVFSGHQLGLLPVDSVTVGPTATPKLAEDSMQALLEQHGYNGVLVNSSGIPLRD